MRVIRLHVSNISRFEELTCEFQPGLNIIIGPNGSGKTSVLESLYCGLYSNVRDKSFFLRSGESSGSISIDFSVNDAVYSLLKQFYKSGATKATLKLLHKDGVPASEDTNLVAYGSKQLKDWIEDTIGTEDASKWYLPQGEVSRFAQDVFSGDTVFLSRLLGLGKVDSLSADTTSILNESYPLQEGEYVSMSSMLAAAQTSVEMCKTRLETIRARMDELGCKGRKPLEVVLEQEARIPVLKDILQLLRLRDQFQGVRKQIEQEQQTIGKLEAEMSSRQKELLKHYGVLRDLAAKRNLILPEDVASGLKLFQSTFSLEKVAAASVRQQHREILIERIQQFEARREEHRNQALSIFRSRPAPVRRKLQQISDRLAIIKKDLDFLGKARDGLHSHDDVCPTCLRPLTLEDREAVVSRLRSVQEEWDNLQSQYTVLRGQHSKRATTTSWFQSAASALKNEFGPPNHPAAGKEWQELKKYEEHDKEMLVLEKEMDWSILNTVDKLMLEVQSLQFTANKSKELLESLKNSYQKAPKRELWQDLPPELTVEQTVSELSNLENSCSTLRHLMKEYESVSSTLSLSEQQLKELEPALKRLEDRKKFRQFVTTEVVQPFVRGAGQVIRQYLGDVVLKEVNTLCKRLDFPFCLNVVNDEVGMRFSAVTPYGVVPVSKLSFGQRVLLSIITAFVFYVNSNSSGVLLADEPTAGLDSKNVNALLGLFDALHDLSVSKRVQCIFTSHEHSLYSSSTFNIIDLSSTVR